MNKTYYWSVEGEASKLGQKNISSVNQFSIQEKEILSAIKQIQDRTLENIDPEPTELTRFTPPTLIEPKEDLIMEEGKIPNLKFTWKKQDMKLSYTLLIFKTITEKEELFHKETTSKNFIDLKEETLLTKGEYSWVLESKLIDKGNKIQTKKSDKRSYTILPVLTPPKIKKPAVQFLEE